MKESLDILGNKPIRSPCRELGEKIDSNPQNIRRQPAAG